ncbi:MAG: Peptidyl-prolyl cis-trans isomerase-like 1, partial [Paramarteilia canceri]
MSYYDNCIFHKLAPNFIAQTGDPTHTGFGGSSAFGGHFNDEIGPDLKFTGAGILAMASASPNQNGSQFFITLGLTSELNGKYSIFGRISRGIDVISKLNRVEVENFKPTTQIKILKAFTLSPN